MVELESGEMSWNAKQLRRLAAQFEAGTGA
jgi:hypothetical protein